jgi:tetratricopeptide (TPR) repeat protein
MLGPQLKEDLNRALRLRHVAEGVKLLDQSESSWMNLTQQSPNAAELLFSIAQWIDVGYKDYRLLDSLLERFPVEFRRRMPLDDYLRLRMVEAFRALSVWDADTAIEALDFVLRAQKESPDRYLVTVAHFWKARAHRKKGEYEAALQDIVQARKLAQSSQEDAMLTAVIQVQESWLLFQKGHRKDAWKLLAHAETVLGATDHYLALGNIESARGRIERRAGEYAKALDHFDRAVAIYSKGYPDHRNVARTLVNAAYVKRLLALQIRKRIDAYASKLSPARGGSQIRTASPSANALRIRYQQLCDEAMLQLERAKKIYASFAHAGGIGSVLFNTGYLHLDRGEIDHAAREAQEAYRIGQEKSDHILMARARILQATTENAHVEEQLGEDVDTAIHANHAKQYSEEALDLAHQTQNRRLLAGALIARGMTAANDFFQEWELAAHCASEAAELIGSGENDHLLDDLTALKSRIVQVHGINDTLRAWSEGLVGEKTFQQITEEFAEIVIPKVWMRAEKKISRVAQSLSISPKKVRRILRNAGLLDHE